MLNALDLDSQVQSPIDIKGLLSFLPQLCGQFLNSAHFPSCSSFNFGYPHLPGTEAHFLLPFFTPASMFTIIPDIFLSKTITLRFKFSSALSILVLFRFLKKLGPLSPSHQCQRYHSFSRNESRFHGVRSFWNVATSLR